METTEAVSETKELRAPIRGGERIVSAPLNDYWGTQETALVADRSWRVLGSEEHLRCIARENREQCPNEAVAVLYRSVKKAHGGTTRRREPRCSDHLYGRVVLLGLVLSEVAALSPSAERGYTE